MDGARERIQGTRQRAIAVVQTRNRALRQSQWIWREVDGLERLKKKKKTQVIGRGGRLTGRHQGWCPGNGAVTELGNPAGDWKPAGDEERLFTPQHTFGGHPVRPLWCLIQRTFTQGGPPGPQLSKSWRSLPKGLFHGESYPHWVLPLTLFLLCLLRLKLECISWSGLLRNKSLPVLDPFIISLYFGNKLSGEKTLPLLSGLEY